METDVNTTNRETKEQMEKLHNKLYEKN